MTLAILGLGTAVPPVSVTRQEGQQIARWVNCHSADQAGWLPHIYGQSGIDKRHMCLGRAVIRDILDETRVSQSIFLPRTRTDDRGPTTAERMAAYRDEAPRLAIESTRMALARSGLSAEDITHLVTVSCTGFQAPGVDVALIESLKLARTTQRTHVGYMGCHGALNGLRVARAFVDADPRARVLVCAVELCSLHYHYGWDPQKLIANALFADGAAAVVAGPVEIAPDSAWRVAACGSCLIPDSTDAMTWTVGDHGFGMTLSKKVPSLIAAHLRPWLEQWLADNGVRLEDVVSWAIHPGGPRILEAVVESLRLDQQAARASREVFAAYGNMSSPTVLFILEYLRERGAARPCVALGFGPGLNAEATLIR
jgi:predicted naringenin-chalcone synthase